MAAFLAQPMTKQLQQWHTSATPMRHTRLWPPCCALQPAMRAAACCYASTTWRSACCRTSPTAASAAAILSCLVQQAAGRALFLRHKATVPALAACSLSSDEGAVLSALTALECLAGDKAGAVAVMKQAVPAVMHGLKGATPSVQRHTLSLLATVLATTADMGQDMGDGISNMTDRLMAIGALPLVMDAIGSSNEATVVIGVDLVEALLALLPECADSTDSFAQKFARALLQSWQHYGSEHVPSCVLSALDTITDRCCPSHLMLPGGLPGEVPFLVANAAHSNETIATTALQCLRYVARRPRGIDAILDHPQGMAVVIEGLGRGPEAQVPAGSILRKTLDHASAWPKVLDAVRDVVTRAKELGSIQQCADNLRMAILQAADKWAGSRRGGTAASNTVAAAPPTPAATPPTPAAAPASATSHTAAAAEAAPPPTVAARAAPPEQVLNTCFM